MNKKIAILGYDTINIGDDIQSYVISTHVDPDYIILRDDHDQIWDFKTGERLTNGLREEVVLVMNGWFMHSPDKKYNISKLKFPIKNPLITPFYISTCLSKKVFELYQNEKLKNYKENQPFLCRDKTTYDLLTNKNVACEYFGCMTQTLNVENVPKNIEYEKKYSGATLYVDSKNSFNKKSSFCFEHYDMSLNKKSPLERIKIAADTLSKYQYAKKIYTSRLHCFLPCRAMGIDVEFDGDLCYRTKDLVKETPDKDKLLKTFLDLLEEKRNG